MYRKANHGEAEAILRLINFHAETGQMLFRTLRDIRQNIGDFFVCDEEGELLAACSLRYGWDSAGSRNPLAEPGRPPIRFERDAKFDASHAEVPRLVEIRSLAVHPRHYRRGLATALVRECIEEAMTADMEKIFVLTYAAPFFTKLGFKVIDKAALPLKVWNDCTGCGKRDHCDETAMIRDLHPLAAQRPEEKFVSALSGEE